METNSVTAQAGASGILTHGIDGRPGCGQPDYRLRPGSRGMLMKCPVSVNHLGFRGEEISKEKGNAYRIVALGESTTFGMTVTADGKPWPEILEQLIRKRLKPRRPIEVINAGIPGYTILDNLSRLPSQILPLKPDMIISYHGVNGFYMIAKSLNYPRGEPMPEEDDRPLRIAGEVEYRLRLLRYNHRTKVVAPGRIAATQDPIRGPYADAYRELIKIAATNKIRLALATYNMAVNKASPAAVVEFYQGGESDSVGEQVEANVVHSRILRQLASENPCICLLDTHSNLDGEHEKFIDLVHFAPAGEQQMAENIFDGIKQTLTDELGP